MVRIGREVQTSRRCREVTAPLWRQTRRAIIAAVVIVQYGLT